MLLKLTLPREPQSAAVDAEPAFLGGRPLASEDQPALTADDERLARARGGDAAAFAELVRRHQAMVFSLAWRIVSNRALAEELAQDVFLQLHRHLAHLESGAHVVHWLRRVVAHRAIDVARQHARRPQTNLADVPEPAIQVVPRDPLMVRRLRALLATLPAAPRAVLTLRFQEDLEPSEIARVLDMPVNTVKSHLRRGLAVLRGRAQSLVESKS
jgi:RNA polymerase sigma-70 factor (ECF subfamily)